MYTLICLKRSIKGIVSQDRGELLMRPEVFRSAALIVQHFFQSVKREGFLSYTAILVIFGEKIQPITPYVHCKLVKIFELFFFLKKKPTHSVLRCWIFYQPNVQLRNEISGWSCGKYISLYNSNQFPLAKFQCFVADLILNRVQFHMQEAH